jgi:HSP20 family protein
MPTIIRKSHTTLMETRREIFNAINWHVRSSVWNPPTDVYETEENVVVKMEIAGMRDEDLEVALQENVLMISGSRSDASERRAYHQMEIPYGKFAIAIDLPALVKMEGAAAEYRDGFLTIHLPKANSDQVEVE